VCFGHMKKMDFHTEKTKKKEANTFILIIMCTRVRSSTCTTRGPGTSNMVWFITILLRALLLDEL